MSSAQPAPEVLLLPSASVARPGTRVAFAIFNAGTGVVFFGLPYTLERRESDGWVELPSAPFNLPGLVLGPGQEREMFAAIPEEAPAGRYRIRKNVRVGPHSRPSMGASSWALFAPKKAAGADRRPEILSFEFAVIAT